MFPYNKRFCPMCNEKLLFEDTNGQIASRSPVRTEANVMFSNGHTVRTVLCKPCAKNPDFQKWIASVLHEHASVSPHVQSYIRDCGDPIQVTEAERR